MWCDGAVDRVQVHAADRVDHGARHVAVDPDVGLPGPAAEVGQRGPAPARPEVPVVDEGVLHVPDDVAGEPGVGVAPVGRVQRCRCCSRRGRRPWSSTTRSLRWSRPVLRGNRKPDAISGCRRTAMLAGKGRSRRRTTRLANSSKTTVDLDATVGRVDQRVLERLADGVALPDEGLEEDPGLGLPDGVEHVAVEVLAVGVDGDLRAPAVTDRGGDRGKVAGLRSRLRR